MKALLVMLYLFSTRKRVRACPGDDIAGNLARGYISLRRSSRTTLVSSMIMGFEALGGNGRLNMSANSGDALCKISESTLNSTPSLEARTISPSGYERNSRGTGTLHETAAFTELEVDIEEMDFRAGFRLGLGGTSSRDGVQQIIKNALQR